MQTKQERLRYGQQLRRQIQMRQEQKKMQTMEKRKNTEPARNNQQNFTIAPQKQQSTNSIAYKERPTNTYNPTQSPPVSVINKKEVYQKKLEEEAYFPFGRVGGRAGQSRIKEERESNNGNVGRSGQEYDYSSQEPVSHPSQPQTVPIYNPHHYIAQQQEIAQHRPPPQSYSQPPYQQPQPQYAPPNYQPYPLQNQYNSIPQMPPPHYQQQQPQNQYYQPEFYHPSMMEDKVRGQQKMSHQQLRGREREQQYYNQPVYEQPVSQENIGASSRQPNRQEPVNYQRPDVNVAKRNILQFQNQTNQAISKKMRSKQETKNILQEQILQKKRLKQQEEQRIRRQDLKLQAENRRYMELQSKRIEEQNNKKQRQQDAKRQNQERSKQMREKMERQAMEEKKKKRMNIPQYVPPQPVEVIRAEVEEQVVQPVSRQRVRHQRVEQPEESIEPQSDQYYQSIEKAFNTDISRDAIRLQKERDQDRKKNDKQFIELKKNINNMKQELISHNEIQRLEREKSLLEIERIKLEKQKAEQELYRLKQELYHKKEDRDHDERLKIALKKTDRERQRQREMQVETPTPKPMKPKQEQMFVKKTYSYEVKQPYKKIEYPPEQQKQYLVNPQISNTNNSQFEEGLQSLYGQTVKIPINLGVNNLTMSNIDQFDIKNLPKQSAFSKQPQQPQHQQQQVEYEDPIKRQFRKHLSGQDQLDKFMKQPPKQSNKWGQMSSIDSEGTKQIEQLLKQHQFQYGKEQKHSARPGSRPKSKLSNVGKQSLNANLGYAADGFTLQSNVNDGTYNTNGDGTFNLLRINEKNDHRLNRLKQMGLETVGQDDEVNQLDRLLDKYGN